MNVARCASGTYSGAAVCMSSSSSRTTGTSLDMFAREINAPAVTPFDVPIG